MTEPERPLEPLLDVERIIPFLNKISIFGGLDDKQLYTLFRQLRMVKYRKDEIIIHQGTQANYIYVIASGRVKVYLEEDHQALELVEFSQGNCFGETSLIGILAHTANVIAEEDTELIVLSGKALHEFYKTDLELFSKIILNIARESCRRLSRTDDAMLHFALKDRDKEST